MASPAIQMLTAVTAGDAAAVAALLNTDDELANLAERGAQRLSVLHHAASRGHLAIVELLLAAGANVNKRSHNGSTPLHEAALAGHLDVARALVASGAETRATTNSGHSALDAAQTKGHQAMVELLKDHPQPTLRNTFRGKREWS